MSQRRGSKGPGYRARKTEEEQRAMPLMPFGNRRIQWFMKPEGAKA